MNDDGGLLRVGVETTTRRTPAFRVVVTVANDPRVVVIVRIIIIVGVARVNEWTRTVRKVKAVRSRRVRVTSLGYGVFGSYIIGHLVCTRKVLYGCKVVLVIYPL